MRTGTTELKRLESDFLLIEILDRFMNKTLSLLPDQLMQIYSGHDSTIEGMLNSLGVFEVLIKDIRKCNTRYNLRTRMNFLSATHSSIFIQCLV